MTKLITEWRDVLLKAWSMRWWALSLLLGGVEYLVPYFDGKVAPNIFTTLSLVAGICGMVARLMAQPSTGDKSDAPAK